MRQIHYFVLIFCSFLSSAFAMEMDELEPVSPPRYASIPGTESEDEEEFDSIDILLYTKHYEAAAKEITDLGARVTHKFTDTVLVARIPSQLVDLTNKLSASFLTPPEPLDDRSQFMVRAWKEMEVRQESEKREKQLGIVREKEKLILPLRQVTVVPATTSQIFTGTVAIGIVIVSGRTSTGTDYTFSNDTQSNVFSKVFAATNFFSSKAPKGANLQFTYHLYLPNIGTVDPGPAADYRNDEALEAPWRDAALIKMGFGPGKIGINNFVQATLASSGSTSAIAGFFTQYPLTHFAYAHGYSNQRFVISPNYYDDDGQLQHNGGGWWQWPEMPDDNNINLVIAHETGHLFGAADEAYAADTIAGSGYNNVPNGNCETFAKDKQVSCVMNKPYEEPLDICPYSRGQIGWGWNFSSPTTIPQQGTGGAISSAVFNKRLYTFWHGRTDNNIHYSSFDGSKWDPTSHIIPKQIMSGEMSSSVLKNKLYTFWKDGISKKVSYISFDGTNWGPVDTIHGHTTSGSISSAELNGRLYTFWKDEFSKKIFYCSFDGNNWTPNLGTIPNQTTDGAMSSAVLNGRIYTFWKGNGNNNIYYISFDGTNWDHQARTIPNETTGGDISSAVLNNNLYVFWRASSSSSIYYSSTLDGENWNFYRQRTIPAQTTGGAISSTVLGKRLYTFWKGATYGGVYYDYFRQ